VARLERLLAALPVPASDGRKAALLDDLAAAGPVIKAVPSLAGRSWSGWAGGAAFAAAWKPLVGVAAAAAVAAGAWVAFKPAPRAPEVVEHRRHPLLEKLVGRDVALARAVTPVARLEVLGGLAEDLRAEARDLARAAEPDELNEIARWYEKVVLGGLVKQAEKIGPFAVPVHERAQELGRHADRLERAGGDVDQLARDVPPGAKPALDRMSKAAREGQVKLRALAGKGV
jgi:hypothetical protein